ncbi:hypothetical protein [Geoalkalibacter sp.]|uniref:hypothetical protein n=1 Tax=Geoalkalibacter sp. TaxID=3041440 RepID=UPI00272E9377|nr:hypothetical protein [Geoalkalibacter sp.]
MSIDLKVLEKAIAAKDLAFIAKRLAETARQFGWSEEDIVRLGERLAEQGRR